MLVKVNKQHIAMIHMASVDIVSSLVLHKFYYNQSILLVNLSIRIAFLLLHSPYHSETYGGSNRNALFQVLLSYCELDIVL